MVLLVSAGAILAIDQITKAFVTATLAFGETWTPIPAIGDFFAITRSANTGAAFSLLPQAGDIFLLIALGMIVAIFVFYWRMPAGHWLERIALGLLLGGVAGNALDRIRLGYVVDFVHLQLKPLISNVSNLADHAIVVSIVTLWLAQWLIRPDKEPDNQNSQNSQKIDNNTDNVPPATPR
ncbi:MAG: signal peptidase II [Chloroflexota bacterium]